MSDSTNRVSARMELGTGSPSDAPETLPAPSSLGPRVGHTPVDLARSHPVPDIERPLHVVPGDDGWMLRFESDGTVAGVYPRKSDAMQAARKLAAERDLRIVEHGADGRIRS